MNIKIRILFNLLWSGYIGGRHTSVDNVIKNFPRNERKKANKALKKCYKWRISHSETNSLRSRN